MENRSTRIGRQRSRFNALKSRLEHLTVTIDEAQLSMNKILYEQDLLEKSTLAIQQARPLLSATSIKQCEELGNTMLSTVFNLPYTVEYDVESCRFVLNNGEFTTDLTESNGGGLVTALSFVFQCYLLVKKGARMFMVLDEVWTQISDQYFNDFLQFVNKLCEDLGCDILLISHDSRITMSDVSSAYRLENGTVHKLK